MGKEKIEKQKELVELKRLISENRNLGYFTNMWLNHLIEKYPLEYLMFNQYNSVPTGRKQQITEILKEQWISRLSEIQKLPLNQKDIDFLNWVVDQLDSYIIRKKSELNN